MSFDDELEDDGAAPSALHAKIVPQAHSRPIAPWVLPVVCSLIAGGVAFGVAHWNAGPQIGSFEARAADAPAPESSRLPTAPPTQRPTPSPAPVRTAAPPPRQVEQVVPPAPAAAAPVPPAAPPTDSPEDAARKEDIRRGLEARHQSTVVALDIPSPAAKAVVVVQSSAGQPASGYDLLPSAIITGRWDINVDSVVPNGMLRGTIVKDVLDSTGAHVVLPAGGTLVGTYGAVDAGGVTRLASQWFEVQVDGREIPFDGSGSGAKGENGLSASVESGAGRAFGQAALYTLLDAVPAIASSALSRNGAINFNTVSVEPPPRPLPKLHIRAGDLFTVTVRTKFTVPH